MNKPQKYYSKFKSWNTSKLQFVLDSAPYYVNENGTDFSNELSEIREEYYTRMNKQDQLEEKRMIREFNSSKR